MSVKPQFNKKRPLSFSSYNKFKYSPEEWYKSYVLGIWPPPNKELTFGSFVDKKLQDDPKFLPQIERYPVSQYKMEVNFGKIPLVGLADGFDQKGFRLKDDKTGKVLWDQKRADETEQLTFYAFLLYLTLKIRPEKMDFFIYWIPTVEKGDFTIQFRDNPVVPVIFKTKRTMKQVLQMGKDINRTWKEMEAYAKNHA